MSKLQIITKGILKENPIFVLVLGMCPTLGVTSSAINGMGMGVATMAVLIMSNMVIALIKKSEIVSAPSGTGSGRGAKMRITELEPVPRYLSRVTDPPKSA